MLILSWVGEIEMTFSEEGEEDSFIVELLNATERHGDGKLQRFDRYATLALRHRVLRPLVW